MRVGEEASTGRLAPTPASVGHVAGMLLAEGLRDTWRLRTPPEWSAEARARGGLDGHVEVPDLIVEVRIHAEGPEHFHLWDTWHHRTHPRAVEWVRGRWPGEMESDRRGPAALVLRA